MLCLNLRFAIWGARNAVWISRWIAANKSKSFPLFAKLRLLTREHRDRWCPAKAVGVWFSFLLLHKVFFSRQNAYLKIPALWDIFVGPEVVPNRMFSFGWSLSPHQTPAKGKILHSGKSWRFLRPYWMATWYWYSRNSCLGRSSRF